MSISNGDFNPGVASRLQSSVTPICRTKDNHAQATSNHELCLLDTNCVIIVGVAKRTCKFVAILKDANPSLCWQLRAVDEYAGSNRMIEPRDSNAPVLLKGNVADF